MINNNNEDDNRNSIILEIGTGSGCVLTYMAMMMKDAKVTNVNCIGIDINIKAVDMAMMTAAKNNVIVEIICADFADGYLSRYDGLVDILIFNPPYVPTSDDELGSDGIEAAWAGGINGRVVIDKFLPIVSRLLSPKGRFYLVVVEENKPKQIINEMANQGLKGEIVLKRQAINEGLQIIRFSRQ
jgi:release factor glutamine methyltransferase